MKPQLKSFSWLDYLKMFLFISAITIGNEYFFNEVDLKVSFIKYLPWILILSYIFILHDRIKDIINHINKQNEIKMTEELSQNIKTYIAKVEENKP